MNIVTTILRKQKVSIILTFLISLVLLGIVFVWNKNLALLIDSVSGGIKVSQQLIFKFIVILLFYVLFSGLSAFFSSFTCENINYDLRNLYIQKMSEHDWDYYQNLSGGKAASKLLNELTSISGFISGNLFFILESAIKFIGTFAWFLILNPTLAIFSNLPVFGILIYVSFTSKILGKYTVEANTQKQKLNAMTESLINMFPVIRLYDAGKMVKQAFETSVEKWQDAVIVSEKKRSFLMSISALLTCIPLMLTIGLGGFMIINRKMTVGELYIFINLSGNVSGILMNMPSFIGQFRVFAGNVKSLEI